MLKISEDRCDKQSTTLQLEGRVVGPWVGELRQVCESIIGNGRKVALDLGEVSFADDNGLQLLAGLRAQGIKLLRITPFVEEQLRSTIPDAAP